MAIIFDSDAGTITGLSVGGLPDGIVDAGTLATDSVSAVKIAANSVDSAELIDGAVDDSHMASISGRKNLVMNGAMKISQRGTSETGKTASDYYTCDRWHIRISSGGTWTITQSTDVPTAEGFTSSLKLDNTATSTDAATRVGIRQYWEGQDLQHLKKGTANAETITVAFWVKATKTGTHICELTDSNSRHCAISYTISSTNTWEHKVVNFPADTSGVIANDNSNEFMIMFWVAAGTNYTSGTLATTWATSSNTNRAVGQVNGADSTSNDFLITGVQLEVGSTATDFEHRSYGEELALCQRYFYKYSTAGMSAYYSSYLTRWFMENTKFPTTMRVVPSIAVVSGVVRFQYWQYGWVSDSLSSIGGTYIQVGSVTLRFLATGSYSPTNHGMYTGEGNTMWVSADAEF
jgi:hypothetical protein